MPLKLYLGNFDWMTRYFILLEIIKKKKNIIVRLYLSQGSGKLQSRSVRFLHVPGKHAWWITNNYYLWPQVGSALSVRKLLLSWLIEPELQVPISNAMRLDETLSWCKRGHRGDLLLSYLLRNEDRWIDPEHACQVLNLWDQIIRARDFGWPPLRFRYQALRLFFMLGGNTVYQSFLAYAW